MRRVLAILLCLILALGGVGTALAGSLYTATGATTVSGATSSQLSNITRAANAIDGYKLYYGDRKSVV